MGSEVHTKSLPAPAGDSLTFYTLLYLSLPLGWWALTWLTLPVGVVLCGGLVYCLAVLARRSPSMRVRLVAGDWGILAVALGWLALVGPAGLVSQRSDWHKHFSMLYELSQTIGPRWVDFEGQSFLLKYYLGMYLLPSAAGAVAGKAALLVVLNLTLFLGMVLTMQWCRRIAGGRWWVAAVVLLAVDGPVPVLALGYHAVEWVAHFPVYISFDQLWASANVAPNDLAWSTASVFRASFNITPHALVTVMGLGLLVEMWRRADFRLLVLVVALVLFWTGLPALLVAAVGAVFAFWPYHGDQGFSLQPLGASLRSALASPITYVGLVAALTVAAYLAEPPGAGWSLSWQAPGSSKVFALGYAAFVAMWLPAGLGVAWCWSRLSPALRVVALVALGLLLVLPLVRVGVQINDFFQKGYLFVALLFGWLLHAIGRQVKARPLQRWLYLGVVLVLSLGSANQAYQAVFAPMAPRPKLETPFEQMDEYTDERFQSMYLSTGQGIFSRYLLRGDEAPKD